MSYVNHVSLYSCASSLAIPFSRNLVSAGNLPRLFGISGYECRAFCAFFAARLNFRNLGNFGRFGKLPAEEVEMYHIDDATLDV